MDNFIAVVGSWFLLFWITWIFVEPGILPESVAFADKVCESNGGGR